MKKETVYEGVERRVWPRRKEDVLQEAGPSFKMMLVVASLVAALVGLGTAWGTATAQLAHLDRTKVDREEQQRTDNELRERLRIAEEKYEQIKPQLDRIELRLSVMYCTSISKNERDGCR